MITKYMLSCLLALFLLSATADAPAQEPGIQKSGKNSIPGLNGELKISEDFEVWPPAGWTFDSPDNGKGWERYAVTQDKLYGGGGYAASAGNQTGGPQGNDQWMISPAITVEAGDKFSFWMYVVNALYYWEKVEIRLSTRGNRTQDFTILLESILLPGGKEYPWTFKWYDISSYTGSTIYIAIREIQPDKTQNTVVLIDQFKLGKLAASDAALSEITLPRYLTPGTAHVTFKVLNLGIAPFYSFTAEYQVDSGKTQIQPIRNFIIDSGKEKSFSMDFRPWDAVSGSHNLKMWISDVLGQGNDENQKNDTLSKNIQVASMSTAHTPLFEEFTSSTCGPCAYYNSQYLNPFFAAHPNDLTLIKYQMNWPGAGDPYYNSDGYARRAFYRCNSVPTLFAGGKVTGLSSSEVLNSALNTETNRKTYLALTSSHQLNKNTGQISVEVNITPYVTSAEFTLYVAIVEKETTGNTRTNGETSFHQVMMKMLPDGKGTLMNLTDKVPNRINLTASLAGTKIEEWSDLAVVAFIQNNETKEMIQSVYSTELNTHAVDPSPSNGMFADVYPSPFSEKLRIRVFQPVPSQLTVEVISPDGRNLWSVRGKTKVSTGEFTWDGTTSSGQKVNPGWYILKISSEKHIIIRKVVFQP